MILLFAFFGMHANGQADSTRVDRKGTNAGVAESSDTLKTEAKKLSKGRIYEESLEHSPRKAMFYSLVLPGAGQAYNKKYFKIPVVYGALGGVAYWVYYNTQGYKEISAIYTDDPNSTNERYLRAWRRNLELSYITLVATHALQVLDAYVDAYLFYWDVDPDLSIRLEPSVEPVLMPGGVPISNYGFKCTLTF